MVSQELTWGSGLMNGENPYSTRPVTRWFMPAAIASLIWYLLGCASYLYQVTLDPASLAVEQRAMVEAAPQWMYAAFAVAVWVGLIGAILLVLRRASAVPLLAVSLIAVMIQFSAYFVHRPLAESMGSDMLLVPIIIVAVTWTVFWFAYHSKKRGWLR
jgi:hypothetical protein